MKTRWLTLLSFIVILALILTASGLSGSPPGALAAPNEPEAPTAMPPPQHTFDGQFRTAFDEDDEVPDTSGDVGITRYIQAVNEAVAIYYKTGDSAVPSTPFDAFWYGAGTGTPCDGNGEVNFHHGQPSVLYDHMAQRWVVMDVAYEDADLGPYYFCIAVTNSTVGETPTSLSPADWWYYALPTNEHSPYYYPDQPRIGLWPDGYYIAADLYDEYNNGLPVTPKGAKVWAVNRDDLVNNSLPFRAKSFTLDEGLGYHGLLPANLKGDPPPTGTPNFFVAVAPQTNFYIWNFSVDWVLDTSSFNPNPTVLSMDTPYSTTPGYLVPQAGNPEQLDIRGDRLNSVMYRMFDGAGYLWASHSVTNPAGGTDLRWYEVREPEDSPYFYHQGVHHPDSIFRWISSIAADGEGNVAVGYSASASSMYPAIRYAGRLVSDPQNQLFQGEATLWAGSTYQDIDPDIYGDWGRKSAMTVDPVDDCVFWYTNQYYDAETGPTEWRTRIGWFRFPTCKQGTTARVSLHTDGTQGNQSSGEPLEAYSVSASENGRWVAFTSEATNLVDSDTNGKRDVFVRDRDVDQDGIYDEPGQVKTVRVSLPDSGSGEANGHSWEVSISFDGRFVAFSSEASNLVNGDTNGTMDVFVHDRDEDGDGNFDEPGQTSVFRASINSRGDQGSARSDQPSLAVDYGPNTGVFVYVAFRSSANNLVDDDGDGVYNDDTNNASDIFLHFHNPFGSWTDRVSVGPYGEQADGSSFTPSVSASIYMILGFPIYSYDVAFASDASNLVYDDFNGYTDVFVRDSVGSTYRASLRTDGAEATNGDSYQPSISADGSFVAFASRADLTYPPDLADTNGYADIYVRNRFNNTTTRISLSFLGAQANGHSYHPAISQDGRYIAFASDASTLALSNEFNGKRDIFLHDQQTHWTRRISSGYNGEADGQSLAPAISADGRHVAYPSFATNLVTNDTNNKWDVFAHDRMGVIPTFLTVASNVPGYPGQPVSVPVMFTGHGQSIDTTAFSIDFDQDCLTYNSYSFSLPSSFSGSVSSNLGDTDGELDITIRYLTAGASLPDGTLLTLNFTVSPTCQTAPDTSRSARVGFSNDPPASFGKNGASIRGKTADGFVEVFSGLLGDCNADGKVDVADVESIVLEIFDGDGTSPANTPLSTFKGNAVGCNPNQDILVDAADISCDILMIFGGSCGNANGAFLTSQDLLQAATPQGKPEVSLGAGWQSGNKYSVPVYYNSGGHSISSMAFSLDIDPARLAEPQPVRLGAMSGFDAAVSFDPQDVDGEVDIVVNDASAPLASLRDGLVLILTFDIVSAGDTAVSVASTVSPNVSFGGVDGLSVPGLGADSESYRIATVPEVFEDQHMIFLPTTLTR